MIDSTTTQVGNLAHWWLSNTTEKNLNMWIWVEDEEMGKDLALHMAKQATGDFAKHNIHFDSLPTYAANAETNNRVFILSQPNHVDTILVTMHPDATGTVLERSATDLEKEHWYAMAQGKLQMPPEEVAILDTAANQNQHDFRQRPPDSILIHQEHPDWEYIKTTIGKHTSVQLTDRVIGEYPKVIHDLLDLK